MKPICPLNELLQELTDDPSVRECKAKPEQNECCVVLFMRYLVQLREDPREFVVVIRELLERHE